MNALLMLLMLNASGCDKGKVQNTAPVTVDTMMVRDPTDPYPFNPSGPRPAPEPWNPPGCKYCW